MTGDSNKTVSRRKFLVASGAAGMTALAGCGQQSSGSGGSGGDGGSDGSGSSGGSDGSGSSGGSDGSGSSDEQGMDTSPLRSDGSSTVFPIANGGGSVWNSNPEAGDEDYWQPGNWDDVGTDQRLADYFAGIYGYEGTGERSNPPFLVNVALSHSGTGVEAVSSGRVDIGNSSGRVEDELPDRDSYENFIDHVLGVDGQPITVSSEIYNAGVTGITIEELRSIYQGDITNWSELGGPDREILVLGRAEGSGTSTAFRANVFDDPEIQLPGIQQRYGQNQQLRTAIEQADNAISYMALAFIDEPDDDNPSVLPISLTVSGTTYEYRGDPGLGAQEYPLSRDLHQYTWENTSVKEAAFINMFLTDYGQETHVRGNNYFGIGPSRIEEERGKLPEPPNGFPSA